MVSKKKTFEHDSLQDLQTIVHYLNAVTEGFRNGKLNLKGREGEIVLQPHGLIRLELRASERADRSRLDLRFTWKPAQEVSEEPEPLDIRSGGE